MRRLTHIMVLAAFVFSCGGQWYLLQGIAWVKMVHDYSQMVPFTEAVSMTFSGKYPCEICKALAEKQQSADNAMCSFEKFEKKFFPPVSIQPTTPVSVAVQYGEFVNSFSSRTDSPPTPPPRRALA
jgi:hypothetical protein